MSRIRWSCNSCSSKSPHALKLDPRTFCQYRTVSPFEMAWRAESTASPDSRPPARSCPCWGRCRAWRRCSRSSPGDRQEELEKRLAGSVLSGQPVISLDNMNGELGGSFLCQLLTQERLEIRPLGQTGNLSVESHATVLANGNNITIAGDLVRRSIQCSLDPQTERPE